MIGISIAMKPYGFGADGVVVPDAPLNLIAVQNGVGQVDLTWDVVDGADGYYIERSDGNNSNYVQIDDSVVNSYSDMGLSSSVYYYRVQAYVGVASSGYSNEVVVFVYLYYDAFLTPEAAPAASPRNAEPGPGVMTFVQTGTKQFSIMDDTDDYLNVSAGTPSGWSNAVASTPAQTRAYGLCLMFEMHRSNVALDAMLGWASSITAPDSNLVHGTWTAATGTYWTPYASDGLFTQVPDITLANTWYAWAIVLRSTGAFFYLKGGVYTDWQLVWVNPNSTAATLYGVFSSYGTAHALRLDDIKIGQLPAPFTADANIATQLIATAISTTTYAGVADGTFDLTVTAPNPLSTTCELRFRVQDASNYWVVYANTDGSISVDSVNGGTPTNRLAPVAGVFTAAALRIVRIRTHGSKINVYTRTSATANWTKRGSEINVSYLDGLTDVVPVAGAGWTLGALQIWNRIPAADAKAALDAL